MKVNNLKSLFLIGLALTTFSTTMMSQKKEKHTEINTIRTSEDLNVSSDSLWKIISHPKMSLWSTLLDSTDYFGEEVFEGVSWSKRISIVNSKGHHESHEDLIAYNNSSMEIKFTSTKFPSFIISNETHYKVINKGKGKSTLEISTYMKMKKIQSAFLKKPMLKAINKNGDGIFYDIKIYAEKGDVSPCKKERMEEVRIGMTEKKGKKVKKTLSKTINISADSLWAIVKKFDKTAEWTSTLRHSYGTGTPTHEGTTCSSRTCETNFGKGNKVVEELIMFSDEKKELSYNLTEGAPGFITLANNHWHVIETESNQSKIEMNVTMNMKSFGGFFLGRLITNQMTKQVNIVLDELKIYAETGKVSKAKRIQLEKLKKK